MSDAACDVLVSTDGGVNWARHPAVPGRKAAAIKRVRDTNAELLANEDALYFATTTPMTATRFAKKLTPTWTAEEIDLKETPKSVTEQAAAEGDGNG